MDKLVIRGGRPLRGPLHVGGSKNTALPLMAAAVLAEGVTTLQNMPVLQDVFTFSNVLRVTGCHVEFDPDTEPSTPDLMRIDATRVGFPEAPYELVNKMRASFYMLGALLGRCGKGRVSLPGGCAWGPRPVDLHLRAMEALGASITEEEGYIIAKAPRGGLRGGRIRFEPSSVGATVNAMLAASTAKGETVIENAAAEPDIIVFGDMLRAMGAQIDGLGTHTITVQGVAGLQPVTFRNCPDRIELGTYMIAAAMAAEPGHTVRLTGAEPAHLGDSFLDAFRATEVPFELGPDWVDVTGVDRIAPVSVEATPYPGFPTDLQAQWTVLMAMADGPSTVTDSIYADRFKHIPELWRMGIRATTDGASVHIAGKDGKPPHGAQVMSTDLRASVSLVLAGMVAEGETHVLRVYHLDRGYERLEAKLTGAGIAIHREQYSE
ncbi:MAG TPA: UDP-N-acetylglucosamine 1-carboxyvinyltransferase [Rhodothermales bacterium]|nr:UDP-N-acetylglucosamine 1-carboxyvinyltransferase [Rhodothermales bacterium]